MQTFGVTNIEYYDMLWYFNISGVVNYSLIYIVYAQYEDIRPHYTTFYR